MKKIIIFILLSIFCMQSHAQISNWFFSSVGMSLVTDFHISSSDLQTKTPEYGEEYVTSYQHMQFNFVSFHFGQRVNLIPISSDMSVSLQVKPKIAYGVAYEVFDGGSWYNFEFQAPIFLEYNYGIVSQYGSKKNVGFVVGAGVAYTMSPMYGYSVSADNVTLEEYKKSWLTVVGELGFRYINKKNIVKEIFFTYGMGKDAKEFINFDGELQKEKQPFSCQLSFSRIINY
ncbi:MAG: hypothetical protein R6U95_02905 [Bacteroidales bacterium]